MSINDLPVLSALRTKMQWHQERQRVLAENISNSDTPNFKPRDLVEPKFNSSGASGPMGSLAMMRTSASHIAPSGGSSSFAQNTQSRLRDPARRQRRQPRRRDAEGVGQPDGLRGRDLALQPQPWTTKNRHRKTLT